jgi:hypothetical protein
VFERAAEAAESLAVEAEHRGRGWCSHPAIRWQRPEAKDAAVCEPSVMCCRHVLRWRLIEAGDQVDESCVDKDRAGNKCPVPFARNCFAQKVPDTYFPLIAKSVTELHLGD